MSMSLLARRFISADFKLVSPSRIRLSVPRRWNSSQARHFKGGVGSYTLAGVAGGLAVVGLGYAWYHFSGVKKVVDSAQRAKSLFHETKQSFLEKKGSNKVLLYLRKVAKTYVAVLPGADLLVDQAFDSVDNVVDAHMEEVTAIANSAYAEIQNIVKDGNEEKSTAKAVKVMYVLRRRLGEIHALEMKAGAEALGPLWAKLPEVTEKTWIEMAELQKLVKDRGLDSRKILGDVQQQVKDIVAEGVNSEKLLSARGLIKEKALKLRGPKPSGDGDVDGKSDDREDSGE